MSEVCSAVAAPREEVERVLRILELRGLVICSPTRGRPAVASLIVHRAPES